ncbi:MAG: hypothetical protein U0U67_09370 [Chitinophagales bacterium]
MKANTRHIFTLILIISIASLIACKKSNSRIASGDALKLPFYFTYYGSIPVNSGIKEIHDTLGVQKNDYYFDTDGKLNKYVYRFYPNISTDTTDPAFTDSLTLIFDRIVYTDNHLTSIGNADYPEVFVFNYDGNGNLSKISQRKFPLNSPSSTIMLTDEFTSNSSGNFTSSIHYESLGCSTNKTYHYTQNKIDSISANPSSGCSVRIFTPTIQFFYTNDLITSFNALTTLAHYDPNTVLIYTNNKLTEIKKLNPTIQGAPHTAFIYY